MTSDIQYLRDESTHQRKIAAIKEAIDAYVQGEPSQEIFTLFLPSTQDLDLIKQAIAGTSLATGKPIRVIYPIEVTQFEQEEPR